MTPGTRRSTSQEPSPEWADFKRAVRRTDRDTLLVEAAAASALLAQDALGEQWRSKGLTPWNIAAVARASLAWGSFNRPAADGSTLVQLCNMVTNLRDPQVDSGARAPGDLARVLLRIFLEQFPGQRGVANEVARTLLLFGPTAECAVEYKPEVMTTGWFEEAAGGLSLEDYVDSIFLISIVAQTSAGRFNPAMLDTQTWQDLEGVVSTRSAKQTFADHLVTTVGEFKIENRRVQGPVPDGQKKFAFNPLADKPFISGITDVPLAPWVQAVVRKAFPPSIYHTGLKHHGEGFTRDLGHYFQQYVGRQLMQIRGECTPIAEVPYGPPSRRRDSCDWILDLPGLTVLVECKARQPIEQVRLGADDWFKSVEASIVKGATQVDRSSRDLLEICQEAPAVDISKPVVGIVVTLEPFYLNENWVAWDSMPDLDLPTGVLSVSELESLVCLSSTELAQALRDAADASVGNVLLLNDALSRSEGRENPLLAQTFDSIGLFTRVASAGAQRASETPS